MNDETASQTEIRERHRGVFAKLAGSAMAPILDRIDRGLETGSLLAMLPDGTVRLLGGRSPGFAVIVDLRKWKALVRLALSGSIGWYEAWAAGEWTSPDPVALFALFMANRTTLGGAARAKGIARLIQRARHWSHRNSRRGARRNIHAHYDLGNDFYSAWLDPTLTYSSAIFDATDESLETAQRRKVTSIVDRLAIAPGGRVLEIGFGWGHLARTLASVGAQVTAITLSANQLATARASHSGVDWRLADYRDIWGHFDAIASVEMVEAVGARYWPDYLDTIARSLVPGGRAAIQFIAIADDVFDRYAHGVDFIQAYIFPGGMLLSASRFRALAEERGLRWADETSFGASYAETLLRWRQNFEAAVAQQRLPAIFDATFIALWRYYLMYCEGGFRGGGIQVSQVTLIKQS